MATDRLRISIAGAATVTQVVITRFVPQNRAAWIIGLSVVVATWTWVGLSRPGSQRQLSIWRRHHPMSLILIAGLVGASIGATAFVYGLRWLLPPRSDYEVVQIPPALGVLQSPHIRSAVQDLVFAIKAASGKGTVADCNTFLQAGEQFGPEKRISLFALMGTPSIGSALHDVLTAMHGVEASGLFRNIQPRSKEVARGYQPVAMAYDALQAKNWILARERYKDGEPLPGDLSRHCAYGMVQIADEAALDYLKRSVDDAERAATQESIKLEHPSFFPLGDLHEKFRRAGVPLTGVSAPQKVITPENDVGPTTYLPTDDGRLLRLVLAAPLTPSQEAVALKVLRRDERTRRIARLITRHVRVVERNANEPANWY